MEMAGERQKERRVTSREDCVWFWLTWVRTLDFRSQVREGVRVPVRTGCSGETEMFGESERSA
jgi:hypothetical protein